MSAHELVRARVHHARRGGAANAFTYGVDFVLAPMRAARGLRPLFARNGLAIAALNDRDHGAGGEGACDWAEEILRMQGLDDALVGEAWLLTQARTFGFLFNPASFWFFTDAGGRLRAVLVEVSNTFGQRHVYVCARGDGAPITADDEIHARKAMYVSPFQEDAGRYAFRFDWRADRVGVRIVLRDEAGGGLLATLAGPRVPMTASRMAVSILRYPFGPLRVFTLILWQALKLMAKGHRFRWPQRASRRQPSISSATPINDQAQAGPKGVATAARTT